MRGLHELRKCRISVTFDTSVPLVLAPGSNLTINCPNPGTRINVYSAASAADTSLTFKSCQVVTVEDIPGAADVDAPPNFGSTFLELEGDTFFEECHIMFPLSVRCTSSA